VLNATTGAGYTYQWQLNGNPISGATASSYTATASGSYTVAVSSGACLAVSSSVTVTVNATPVAVITTGTSTACSVVLNANTGAGLTYQWKLNGNNIGGATASGYTATAIGNYTVVVSNGSCSATSSVTAVTVTPPTATITAVAPVTFCMGGSVVLSANVADSYSWSNGATSQSITVANAGSYSVTITSNGCSATSAATGVTVNTLPGANISGTTTSCGAVSLTASGGTTYTWSGGNTPSSATNTFTIPVLIQLLLRMQTIAARWLQQQ
jgi:hypothetical protein